VPLSPTQTRDLLEELGHRPQKQLGQNFLIDGNIVRKSLELAEVNAGDRIVEVGPGLGTLTEALLSSGAYVYAVEKDPRLARHLSHLDAIEPRLSLLQSDALAHPLATLPAEIAEFKVVANLPYAISTAWMAAVLAGRLPKSMTLMLQREAAQRYAARHGSKQFSPISVFLHSAFDLMPGHEVSSKCFYPRPDVGSTLLHLRRKAAPYCFTSSGARLIREIFQQRRKQVASILRKLDSPQAAYWLSKLDALGIEPTVRPEQVSAQSWISLDSSVKPPYPPAN